MKTGNVSLIMGLCCLGLLGEFYLTQPGVLSQPTTRTNEAKPVRWQPPPNVGASGRRTGNPPKTVHGGSRTACANQGPLPLTALIPASYEGRVGVESPVIYVYFPYEGAPFYPTSFSLKTMKDGAEQMVFESRFRVKGEAGFLDIPLPSSLELDKGLVYRWRFSVQCTASEIDYVEGNLSLEPEEIPAEFLADFATATPLEIAEASLALGWWYDAVQQLLTLKKQKSPNQEVEIIWAEILTKEGLSNLLTIEK
jgi:hypothetical protein